MNGYGSGASRGPGDSSGRRRGTRGNYSGYGGGRPRGGRGYRSGGYRGDRPARPERTPRPALRCPPELREPFMAARDFVAGLIGAIGMPARLSYGGVEPARDGRQVTICIDSVRPAGEPPRGRWGDRDADAENDLGILIGKHGATLEALTALVNAIMHHHDCEGVFFTVDVEGYRARRVSTLRSVADRGAERAAREGIAIELSPMPPSERRIVHLALANYPDVSTQSTGLGINRRVVIVPRGAPPVEDEYDQAPE